jgi:hypothetical protein
MPRFLNDSNRAIIALGRCDRCHFKFYLDQLSSDRNTPGLKVCVRCNDEFDPYRLPAPPADDITLPFYRPDLPDLATPPVPTPMSLAAGLAIEGADIWLEVEGILPSQDDGGMYGIEVIE